MFINQVTISGTVGGKPRSNTSSESGVCFFDIWQNGVPGGENSWFTVATFDHLARLASSLEKGDKVVVSGVLNSYITKTPKYDRITQVRAYQIAKTNKLNPGAGVVDPRKAENLTETENNEVEGV